MVVELTKVVGVAKVVEVAKVLTVTMVCSATKPRRRPEEQKSRAEGQN